MLFSQVTFIDVHIMKPAADRLNGLMQSAMLCTQRHSGGRPVMLVLCPPVDDACLGKMGGAKVPDRSLLCRFVVVGP